MRKTAKELIEQLTTIIGEGNNEDSTLTLIENITDSVSGDGVDWKQRYEDNDAEWRKRYRERFLKKPIDEEEDEDKYKDKNPNEVKKYDFDSLFKKEG